MAEERSFKSIREIYARQAVIDIVDTSGATRATPVYFVCNECSLLYCTTQLRRSKGVLSKMDCVDCGAVVHRWSGLYDFIDWQPVRRERPAA